AAQGLGSMASGGSGILGTPAGSGNIAGPPSPGGPGLQGLSAPLGQIGSSLQSGAQAIGPLAGLFAGGGNKLPQMQPVRGQGGPASPFQSSQPPQAGGGGSILDMLKALLGGKGMGIGGF